MAKMSEEVNFGHLIFSQGNEVKMFSENEIKIGFKFQRRKISIRLSCRDSLCQPLNVYVIHRFLDTRLSLLKGSQN